jgi:hypothetical protein
MVLLLSAMRKLYRDPAHRAKVATLCKVQRDDLMPHAKQVATFRELDRDTAFRAKRLAALREVIWKPAWRAAHSAAMRKLEGDPTWRAHHSAAMRKISSDPAYRAAHDWLPVSEMENLLDALRAKRPYVDVANDWLLSIGHVRKIAEKTWLVFPATSTS